MAVAVVDEAVASSIQVVRGDIVTPMSDTESASTDQPVSDAPEADTAPAPHEPPRSQPTTSKRKPSPRGQAVSGSDTDEVRLSLIVFKNPAARKSLSVHHLQRRLAELGYRDAGTDKDGWYGDLTLKAVAEYQRDNGLAGDGAVNMPTLEHLFADDSNVTVAA